MNLTKQQISSIIKEDPQAILDFYSEIKPFLSLYFYSKIENHKDREEIIQDTIFSTLDSLPRFQFKSKLSTWVRSIAHHELVDYYRRQKIKTVLFSKFPFLENIVDKALGPELTLEEIEAKHQIYKTFKNLSEGYSTILRLRYIEGWSVRQIAAELNITYKAAESKLSRARLAFQQEYTK